jgi:hypothetical protein
VGADKAYDSEDFVRTVRELNVTSPYHEERQQPQQQTGPQNAAAWLRHQSEPPLADRKGLWVVETSWAAPAS